MNDDADEAARGFRLYPPGDLYGVSCDAEGPSIGPIRLLRRTPEGFAPRPPEELDYILRRSGYAVSFLRKMPALEAVATALNAGDLARAMIATQFMRLPSLRGNLSYDRILIADVLVKADKDDDEHPGWPKGTPGGKGGQFRPKDETAAGGRNSLVPNRPGRSSPRAVRKFLRRALRKKYIETLKRTINVYDFIGSKTEHLNDFVELDDLSQMAVDMQSMKVAAEFVRRGPQTLEQLRVGPEDQSFSSYSAFLKMGLSDEEILAKRFGRAGDGWEYHHIVEQGNNSDIPVERLQNTNNIVRIPKLLHEEITSLYGRPAEQAPGMTKRQWLKTKSFEEQEKFGIQTLKDVGFIKKGAAHANDGRR